MFFDLKDKYLPVACPACQASMGGCRGASTFDCNNVESTGDLVVRQLKVEVFGSFGNGYKLCDVWPKYPACDYECFSPRHSHLTPGVGMEAVCGGNNCDMAPAPTWGRRNAWDYWLYNTATLLGNAGKGQWYSLATKDAGKYWRNATIVKTINQRCHSRGVDRLVTTTGKRCFEACPQPANQSSPCWVDCFFATVLGPNANSTLKPVGSQSGGMTVDDLSSAWLSGFRSDEPSAGGCPPCPPSGACPDHEAESPDGRVVVSPGRRAPRPHMPSPPSTSVGGAPAQATA